MPNYDIMHQPGGIYITYPHLNQSLKQYRYTVPVFLLEKNQEPINSFNYICKPVLIIWHVVQWQQPFCPILLKPWKQSSNGP